MNDLNAWKAISKLLRKMEWQEIGRKYDTGDRQSICPICRESEFQGHSNDCELLVVIDSIGQLSK